MTLGTPALVDLNGDGRVNDYYAVSYTHLDVYKRQLRILVPLTIEDAQIRQGLEIISQCFAEAKQ